MSILPPASLDPPAGVVAVPRRRVPRALHVGHFTHAGRGAHVWRAPRALAVPVVSAALLLSLCAIAFTWGWAATPTTAGLDAWVHAQDARHSASYTPLGHISPLVADALLAAEDERFYGHHGIDSLGLMRAAWDDLRSGHFTEGGSTLTAQLAKNAYLNGYDHTIPLKLEDLVLALKVEARYPKARILEMYLNLVYFGEGGYGIGQASERYFGTTPDHLDLAESALLAGLVRAPGMYDPWCHPDLAKLRQGEVLTLMVADGFTTPAQARAAADESFPFWAPGASRPGDTYCAS
ncbi:MAG TPA: biosynthetic peptidoglycan transglycosylase [Ktedonobacterales bacterium]